MSRQLLLVSNKAVKRSGGTLSLMRASYRQERRFEQQSLVARRKLVERRFQTLKALDRKADSADKGLGGIASGFIGGRAAKAGLGILGLGGAGGLVTRGFGGPRGGGWNPFKPKGPRLPSNNIRPTSGLLRGAKGTRGFRVPGLRGGIGPLAVLTTGLDFMGRKADGQTNLEAGVGAGGGLAGALAGGAAGTKAGIVIGGSIGALFGGVGAAPGAAIGGFIGGVGGSIIGGFAGSGIADFFTGANRRRKKDLQQLAIEGAKTPFSLALDRLDSVLDKLERRGLPSPDVAVGRSRDDKIRFGAFAIPKPKNPLGSRILEALSIGMTVLGILSTIAAMWAFAIAEPTPAGEMAAAGATPGLLNILAGKLRTMKLLLFRGGIKMKAGQIKPPNTIIKKFSPNIPRSVKVDPTKMKGFGLSKDSPLKKMEIGKVRNIYMERTKNIPIPRPTKTLDGGPPIDWTTIQKLARPKETGGQVEAGKPYKVGEIGEELFIPNQDGMIVSNAGLNPVTPMTIVNNNSNQMSPPSGGAPAPSGGGSRTVAADPFIAATKYAQMQSLLTV